MGSTTQGQWKRVEDLLSRNPKFGRPKPKNCDWNLGRQVQRELFLLCLDDVATHGDFSTRQILVGHFGAGFGEADGSKTQE